MKKLIDLPDGVVENLEKQAKENKRSIKAHLEYLLIMESNRIVIVNDLKERQK